MGLCPTSTKTITTSTTAPQKQQHNLQDYVKLPNNNDDNDDDDDDDDNDDDDNAAATSPLPKALLLIHRR